MSSLADLIKRQYEKESLEKYKDKKVDKDKKSIMETEKMKRISLWLDKKTYNDIQDLVNKLEKDQLALPYANESELIRSLIKKGYPALISDFKKMFPDLFQ